MQTKTESKQKKTIIEMKWKQKKQHREWTKNPIAVNVAGWSKNLCAASTYNNNFLFLGRNALLDASN